MIYSIPSTTRLLVAEPLAWFALLSNRSNFELNSIRFENHTALRKFENRGIEVSRNQLLMANKNRQKWKVPAGDYYVASPVFLKPWGWTVDVTVRRSLTAPSLSTPTAAKVTPTPIPREMRTEENQAEEERTEAED